MKKKSKPSANMKIDMLFSYLCSINMVYNKIKLHNQASHKYMCLKKNLHTYTIDKATNTSMKNKI